MMQRIFQNYFGEDLIKKIDQYRQKEIEDLAFKKTVRTFKENLPYLNNLFVHFSDDYFFKTASPINYNEFKSKPYNSERKCVSLLLGVPTSDFIFFDWSEIYNSKISEPFREEDREQFHKIWAFQYILLQIKETVSIGLAMNEIKQAEIKAEDGIMCVLFRESLIIETLSFINWFSKNHYSIPKELEFRNEKGNLYWLYEEERANQTLVKNVKIAHRKNRDVDVDSSKRNINELVKILLRKIRPEIDQYYELIKLHVRKKGRTALHISYQDAIEVYESVKTKFEVINNEDIHEKLFGSDKPYRDIKGGIMRNIVLRKYPEAKSHTSDINLSAQALYNLSNALKKS